MKNNSLPGLYLHIPFCQSKCAYCTFYSTTDLSLVPLWLEALKKEIDFYQGYFQPFDSLYLGGGTPSRLSDQEIITLMDLIQSRFDFETDSEITIEANPDDLTLKKIKRFRDSGINRISLGVQSFNDQELMLLGRPHKAQEAEEALYRIRDAGFHNLGIDLIYGLPGQTRDLWMVTIDKALRFQPEHLSCYQLSVEKDTRLWAKKEKGQIALPDESEEELFFLATSQALTERGYIHYEISNFAREASFFSRHNQKYWRRSPTLGLGPSAHSFLGNRRWWNVSSLTEYCRALEKGNPPLGGQEALTEEQVQLERLSLGLRTKEGVDLALVTNKGILEKRLSPLIASGFVSLENQKIVPTLKGFLVADRLPLLL